MCQTSVGQSRKSETEQRRFSSFKMKNKLPTSGRHHLL